jgi:hypothetical protein
MGAMRAAVAAADAVAAFARTRVLANAATTGGSDYAGLTLVFADLTGCRAVWKEALEGWNVQVSQQVLEWQDKARQEGETTQAQADLMRILELRFGSPMPTDLASEIAAERDLDVLSRWLDATITSPGLDAFHAILREEK